MFPKITWICIIVLVGYGAAADIPFVFDENVSSVASYSPAELEQAQKSRPELVGIPPVATSGKNAIIELPVVGGGRSRKGAIERNADDLKELFDTRVEPDHTKVHELAKNIVADHPGDCTIDQVNAIYSYMIAGSSRDQKRGWMYVGPPRGVNNFFYANETIKQSEDKEYIGCGDCGDFAILMSALMESIGGTTRIILATNNSMGNHAYPQVYIGQDNIENSSTEKILNHLRDKYDIDKIFTNIDTNTKDVWLNLDWWLDEEGSHPGGPLFPSDNNIVVYIRTNYPPHPLNLPEIINRPPKMIKLYLDKTSPQETGTEVTVTAKAKDADSDLLLYHFLLNNDPMTEWTEKNQWVWSIDDEVPTGNNRIEVRVRDRMHASPDGFDSRLNVEFEVKERNQKTLIDRLESDKSSPADAGAAITWTAVAKDLDSNTIFYRFFLNGVPMTNWTKDGILVWNTTDDDRGYNQIEVQARDGTNDFQDSFDDKIMASFTITEPQLAYQGRSNQTPVIESLSLDKSNPQDAGESINLTALAYDPENDPVLYRFLLNGKPVTNWTSVNVWHWISSEKEAGKNQIMVQVRDGKHSDPESCDDSATANFEIDIPNQPPNLVSLKPDHSSPQNVGIDLEWIALASDLDGDPILYRFLLNGKPVTDWTIKNAWIWKTAKGEEGENQIEVIVRDGNHASSDNFDDTMSTTFLINEIIEQSKTVKPKILNGIHDPIDYLPPSNPYAQTDDEEWTVKGSGRVGRPGVDPWNPYSR